jgi:hypothetical protein
MSHHAEECLATAARRSKLPDKHTIRMIFPGSDSEPPSASLQLSQHRLGLRNSSRTVVIHSIWWGYIIVENPAQSADTPPWETTLNLVFTGAKCIPPFA